MSWKKPPPRPVKQFTGEIRAREPAPGIGVAEMVARVPEAFRTPMPARIPPTPSGEDARGRRITQSARGEECDIRIPGVCNHDSTTTVWSHFPGLAGGRGMGLKSNDLCGVYSCFACHEVVDMRAPTPAEMSRSEVMLCWHEGHLRSLIKLAIKGIV